MITCFIRYEINPFGVDAIKRNVRGWGEAIPRCGADLIGYFAPHEGRRPPPTACTTWPTSRSTRRISRLRDDPLGRETYEFARRERFIRRKDRLFLRLASASHAPVIVA